MQFTLPTKYWMLIIFVVWGGALLLFGLLRLDTFGLDEGAAHALLLIWSVSDQLINSSFTFGAPDFRALLFFPLGLYWPGSILAAKVFTAILMFIAAMTLYTWCRDTSTQESALISTGLLLIFPATLLQIDSISVGPFLLFLLAMGYVLDKKYRASPHSISSLYFVQILLAATIISLHPMGLAYPLALAWTWYKNPKSIKQQKQIWIGLAISALIVLIMNTGWISIAWLSNPLLSLSAGFFGHTALDAAPPAWEAGLLPIVLLAYLLYKDIKHSVNDFMQTCLIFAMLIGLVAADLNWALISMTYLIYKGIPLIISVNSRLKSQSFVGQRGMVMVVLFILATIFMQGGKAYANYIKSGVLTPEDELIKSIAKEAADPEKDFLGASQWPARTMIASKRDILPLPTNPVNEKNLLLSFNKLTHLIFDQNNANNSELAMILAKHSNLTETVAILAGGVIIKVRRDTVGKDNVPRDQVQTDKDRMGKEPITAINPSTE